MYTLNNWPENRGKGDGLFEYRHQVYQNIVRDHFMTMKTRHLVDTICVSMIVTTTSSLWHTCMHQMTYFEYNLLITNFSIHVIENALRFHVRSFLGIHGIYWGWNRIISHLQVSKNERNTGVMRLNPHTAKYDYNLLLVALYICFVRRSSDYIKRKE